MRHVGRNVYDNMRSLYGRLRRPHFSYFQTRKPNGQYGIFTYDQRVAALEAQDALEREVDEDINRTVEQVLEEQAADARKVGQTARTTEADKVVETGSGKRTVTPTREPSVSPESVKKVVEQRKAEGIVSRAGGVIRGALSKLGGFFRRRR